MSALGSTRGFVCYSHRDKRCVDRLLVHLAPLRKTHAFDIWSDHLLKPGAEWRKEIERSLSTCTIAIVIVSADFFSSKFIQDVELPTLLERAKSTGIRIIPLVAGPCDFKATELAKYQTIHDPDEAWTEMVNYRQERLLAQLAEEIRTSLETPR